MGYDIYDTTNILRENVNSFNRESGNSSNLAESHNLVGEQYAHVMHEVSCD